MKSEVATGIDELKRQFGASTVSSREDGLGGAYVIVEPVTIGAKFKPEATWFGFHMTPQYPYADIYPVFIGADVTRADGVAFSAPITAGHFFENRPAVQVSRRNSSAQSAAQRASAKLLKILAFMESIAS